MSLVSYMAGEWVPTSAVAIPIEDTLQGSIRGLQVFTTALIRDRSIFLLDRHLDRLFEAGKQIDVTPPHTKPELKEIIEETIFRNREGGEGRDLVIRLILSAGTEPDAGNGKLFLTVTVHQAPEARLYERGIALGTIPFEKDYAEIKFTNYIQATLALKKMKKTRAVDAVLYLSTDSSPVVLEGDTFNIFFVKHAKIITPKADGRLLKGITRSAVMAHYSVEERLVSHSELTEFTEAFITSSVRGIMPVASIDELVFSKLGDHSVTRGVMSQFAKMR